MTTVFQKVLNDIFLKQLNVLKFSMLSVVYEDIKKAFRRTGRLFLCLK